MNKRYAEKGESPGVKVFDHVQRPDGTVYTVYERVIARPLPAKDEYTERITEQWEAHLRHVGHEDA